MNTTAVAILASAATAVTTSVAVLTLRQNPAPQYAAAERAVTPDASQAIAGELRALTEQLQAMESRLGRLESSQGPARLDVSAVDAAVRRALARAGEPVVAEESPTEMAVEARPIEDVLAELAGLDGDEYSAVWQRLVEEGRADEVLAALEARAEAAPADPEAQLEVGQAYIARIAEVGNSPLAGKYATQADQAFDRALAIDPEHWSARMHKAVSLSFWPPVFGKQPAAIQQFETLIAQQAQVTPEPKHAQVHLLLGNMYNQMGQPEKALAAWQNGAQMFPNNAELAAQLQLAAGGN